MTSIGIMAIILRIIIITIATIVVTTINIINITAINIIECSLINRKKGRDLDLQRIETSTRKEIEADLNLLLKQYFPNKIEHS